MPKIEGCWQLAIALSVSQIPKSVHRSMQPEFIVHRVDTGDFNSIDLMFRHHIKILERDRKQCFLGTGKEFNFILFARAGHCMAISLLELNSLTYNT